MLPGFPIRLRLLTVSLFDYRFTFGGMARRGGDMANSKCHCGPDAGNEATCCMSTNFVIPAFQVRKILWEGLSLFPTLLVNASTFPPTISDHRDWIGWARWQANWVRKHTGCFTPICEWASFLVHRIRHFVLLVNILSHFYISRSAIKMRTKNKQRKSMYLSNNYPLTHPYSGQEPTWGSSWPTALQKMSAPDQPGDMLVLARCACCENIGSIFIPDGWRFWSRFNFQVPRTFSQFGGVLLDFEDIILFCNF